ncbi:tripartite motif-containing protein 3 [Elysia marginata]|uniref:Tripartite motif-containing protein 3 n=1 Tax=Elysia marginata TaxID=1093978 RepID=A0AAV4HVV7_9GAST|nr:tripartite motif-containing protein 3 [Elysia marginata]
MITRRLDYILLGEDLARDVAETYIKSLGFSDHRPIYVILSVTPFEIGTSTLKLNTSLLPDHAYVHMKNNLFHGAKDKLSNLGPHQRWEMIKLEIKEISRQYVRFRCTKHKFNKNDDFIPFLACNIPVMANSKPGAMEEEFLSCPICFDVFKEPKTLSCLHRFCEECLHNFLLRHKTSAIARQRGFNCPVCREFIRAPDPSRPPTEWAALFKTDFHLKNLIKFVESRPGRRLDRPANPCSLHGHAECDLYCADCNSVICHLCAGISHRGCSRVFTVSEAARDKRAEAGARLKELSAKIKEASDLEKSREKCLDQLDSQRAAAEKAIANIIKELHSRIKVAEDKLMNKLRDDFESIHGKITIKVVQFENDISKLKQEVEMFSSNMNSIQDIEVLKLTSFPQFGNLQNGIDIKSYRSFLANVASIKIVVDKQSIPPIHLGEISMKGVDDEVLVTSSNIFPSLSSSGTSAAEPKSILDRIRNIGKKNDTVVSASVDRHVHEGEQPQIPRSHPSLHRKPSRASTVGKQAGSVPPNMSTDNGRSSLVEQQMCNSGAVLTFNNLIRNGGGLSESSQVNSQSSSSLMDNDQAYESLEEAPVSVSRLRTINTRFREDQETPKLRDLIVLRGGEMVLVTDWSNQCVKVIYGRRERNARLVLGGKPWAITQISDNLAAVSLPMSTQICVIKISPTLSVQNSFVSSKRYTGLACLSNCMLVATGDSQPPSVDIIDLYGEVLKSFSLDKQGVPMFEYPAYLCVTPGAMILVTDRKKGAVICLTPTGDVKYRFQPEGSRRLKEPCGIVSDCTGRALVAESRGLLALTPTGRFGSVLVGPRDGLLDDPRGAALCDGGADDLVYVTSADQNIEVLRLR